MVDYRWLSAGEVIQRVGAVKAVYAAVFSESPYGEGPDAHDEFADRIRDHSAQPGFAFVAALDGGSMVGFAYGHECPPGWWWDGANEPAPREVRAGPTFAVIEWAVLAGHRGHGIGRALMDALLADRPEPYATLTVNPAAAARAIYQRWGWTLVATTEPGKMPAMHVLLMRLSARPA